MENTLNLRTDEAAEICAFAGENVHVSFVDDLSRLLIANDTGCETVKKLKIVNCFASKPQCISLDAVSSYTRLLNSLWLFSERSGQTDELSALFSTLIKNTFNLNNRLIEQNVTDFVINAFSKFDLTNVDNCLCQMAINALNVICDLTLSNGLCLDLDLNEFGSKIIKQCQLVPFTSLNNLMNLLHKIVLIENHDELLKCLWDDQEKILLESNSSETVLRALTVVCHLSDSFMSFGPASYGLFDKPVFWKTIQVTIASSDSLVRKLSLYLLNKSVNELGNSDVSINCDLVWWDLESKEKFSSVYATLCIIFETLEQTQVHIILQVFPEIEKLLSTELIHPTWISSIFRRLFNQSSVVLIRKTVIYFSGIDSKFIHRDYNYSLLFLDFFTALNCMQLFFDSGDDHSVYVYVNYWFCSFQKRSYSESLFREILISISKVSWSPIPLFYVTRALSFVEPVPSWDAESLKILKTFIIETLRTQTVIIRGAIQSQLLNCLIKFCIKNITLEQLVDVLGAFKADECLQRGSTEWDQCKVWIRSLAIKQNDVTEFVNTHLNEEKCLCSLQATTKILLLLSETSLFSLDHEDHLEPVANLYNSLENCEIRPYSCLNQQNFAIGFLFNYVKLAGDGTIVPFNVVHRTIWDNLYYGLTFINHRYKFICSFKDYSSVELYCNFLDLIYSSKWHAKSNFDILFEMHTAASEDLANDNLPLVQEYFALKIVTHFFSFTCKNQILNTRQTLPNFMEIFVKRILHGALIKEEEVPLESKGLANILVSRNIEFSWECLAMYLTELTGHETFFAHFPSNRLMDKAIEAVTVSAKQSASPIFKVFRRILKHYTSADITRFISHTWHHCFEGGKSEQFWNALNEWVSMVFCHELVDRVELHSVINQVKMVFHVMEDFPPKINSNFCSMPPFQGFYFGS